MTRITATAPDGTPCWWRFDDDQGRVFYSYLGLRGWAYASAHTATLCFYEGRIEQGIATLRKAGFAVEVG